MRGINKMNIIFHKINIKNFKSIHNLSIEFGNKTFIYGANEVGKTTVADAISWVLTGKNSAGESQFGFIPVSSNGVSPEVELQLRIDENSFNLKRVYQFMTTRVASYKTICYINGLEVSVKEFENWIEDHICNYEIFRLLHDVRYFTENISVKNERPWESQRRMLFLISGIKSDIHFAKNKSKYADIIEGIQKYGGVNQYIKYLSQHQKDMKDTIARHRKEIQELSLSISNKQEEVRPPKIPMDSLDTVVHECVGKLYSLDYYEFLSKELKETEEYLIELHAAYSSIGIQCPTCRQYMPSDIVEEQKRIYEEKIKATQEKCIEIRNQLKGLKQKDVDCNSDLKSLDASELLYSLFNEAYLKDAKDRINTLNDTIKQLLEEQAEINRLIDLCKDFINDKCKYAKKKVDDLFYGVKFELFRKNKSDGEFRECCDVFWNEVPYRSLSYSTKFLVSLKIVYAFQNFYNVHFPVIIDNSESIDLDVDIPVQSIFLVKQDELCPVCNASVRMKGSDNLWMCPFCQNKFSKKLYVITK